MHRSIFGINTERRYKRMTREQIEALSGQIVTDDQFEEIEQHEEVARVENNGNSGSIPGATWYTVYFVDGEEMDIYYKPEN